MEKGERIVNEPTGCGQIGTGCATTALGEASPGRTTLKTAFLGEFFCFLHYRSSNKVQMFVETERHGEETQSD